MATPATIWSTDGGAGLQDGTSLANAYDLPDGITAINALGALTQPLEHKICSDAAITLAATLELTKDATGPYRIRHRGRNAADTADTEVCLDANGGAFPVWTCTTAVMHIFKHLYAYNTDQAAGNSGWLVTAGARGIAFDNCRASHCYRGFDSSTATGCGYWRCLAHNNANHGLFVHPAYSGGQLCKARDNGAFGFYQGDWSLAIAYNNSAGFVRPTRMLTNCIAHSNDGHGFYGSLSTTILAPAALLACVAISNGGYGYYTDASYHIHLESCVDYNNTSGRLDSTGWAEDNDGITCTADPFVNAAAGDFTPNKVAGGGLLLENLGFTHLDALMTTYLTAGGIARFNCGPRIIPAGGLL